MCALLGGELGPHVRQCGLVAQVVGNKKVNDGALLFTTIGLQQNYIINKTSASAGLQDAYPTIRP